MAVFKKLKKGKDKGAPLPEPEPVKQLDRRVGLDCYRDFFTLKNYWKAVERKKPDSQAMFFARYINQNSDNKAVYKGLKNVSTPISEDCADPGFLKIAEAYLKLFDEVITKVEENPGNVQQACSILSDCGKKHRERQIPSMTSLSFQTMEEPFIYMVREVLQDRFNDKAENLFRKFFQFCLKYLSDGYNGTSS